LNQQQTLKNAVFWDVTLRGSCKERCFEGMNCRFLQEPYGVTSQKTTYFTVTAVKPQIKHCLLCVSLRQTEIVVMCLEFLGLEQFNL
jgi:hypothetical protein